MKVKYAPVRIFAVNCSRIEDQNPHSDADVMEGSGVKTLNQFFCVAVNFTAQETVCTWLMISRFQQTVFRLFC